MELVFTTFALFLVTIVASYIFYQRIKMAQTEYEGSKNIVRTITSGFTRQVKKMESDLNRIEKETLQAKYIATEAIAAKQGNSEATLVGLEKVQELSVRVNGIEESIDNMKKDLSKLASQPRVIVPARESVDAPIPVQGEDIQKDKRTISILENLDFDNFKFIDACGYFPLMIMMQICKSKNRKPVLVKYKNSGDIIDDKETVVGYAGMWF